MDNLGFNSDFAFSSVLPMEPWWGQPHPQSFLPTLVILVLLQLAGTPEIVQVSSFYRQKASRSSGCDNSYSSHFRAFI